MDTSTKKGITTLSHLPQSDGDDDDEGCTDQGPPVPLPTSTIHPDDQGHVIGAIEDTSGGGGLSTRKSRCLERQAAKDKRASAALGGAAHDDDDGEPIYDELADEEGEEEEGEEEEEVAPMTKVS